MSKSDDFKETFKDFAKAKAAATLPIEAMEDVQAKARALAREQRIRRARRENLTHKSVGQLVFSVPVGEKHKPLPHLTVELWDRDIGTPDDFLGRATCDAEGRFEIAYDPDDAGAFDKPDLELRV